MPAPIHSTGRGGAGNIGPDDTQYVDGDIIREGNPQQDGNYRGGRGGAGNTHHTHGEPVAKGPKSEDVIPEPAFRSSEGYENYHTGRGGQGNVHREEFGGHSRAQPTGQKHHESLLDKAKHAIGLDKKDKHTETKPTS